MQNSATGKFLPRLTFQTLLIMRMLVVFILAASLQVHARVTAQTVTYSFKNTKMEDVFKEIKRQTGFGFMYNSHVLEVAKPVTIEFDNKALKEVLDDCFRNQPLTYEINNKTVVVKEKVIVAITQTAIPESAAPFANIDVHGIVKDESGKVVAGVSVQIKGTQRGTATNDNGEFSLANVDPSATLVFSSVNLQTFEVKVSTIKNGDLSIILKARVNELSDITITSVNTGYQAIPKERATGSFVQIDNNLINRSVSTDILSRLNGVASGLNFNKNVVLGTNRSALEIRGRSTIMSNPNPLIVVDNFPYDGDINNINPNDIESITILKDAAAASVWGAFSGNGVIVITTKKGKYNQPTKISINSNITIGDKPDLYYTPRLSSSDYIDIEQFLYSKGYYNSTISSKTSVISPVIDILSRQASGAISASDATAQLDLLRKQDVRNDFNKYFYQKAINQQHSVNLSGGGLNDQYFLSTGFDNNVSNLDRNSYYRFTLSASNTYLFAKSKGEISTGVYFAQSSSQNNNTGTTGVVYPYISLADNHGNALPVYANYKKAYLDTAGQGMLLDWNYRPLQELQLANNKTNLTDYRLNASIKYSIIKGLDAKVTYQFSRGISNNENYHDQQSFFTRNLINAYSQVNFTTKSVIRPIPLGNILDLGSTNYFSHSGRGQVDFVRSFNETNQLNVIAGTEIRDIENQTRINRLYGYNPSIQTSSLVNYSDLFPLYYNSGTTSRIPLNISQQQVKTISRFLSYFANAGYSFNSSRYVFSGSIRKDEANLFGVSANQKGVPLWSVGFSWNLSKESFYNFSWLPYLRLRITEGYNGNVNNSTSAFTTASVSTAPNLFGEAYSFIANPPNPYLQWERINTINFGLDFGTRGNVVNGTIEYYTKRAADLIGNAPIDPTMGVAVFTGNVANMSGKGIDITLNSKNIDHTRFKWYSTFLLSYSTDKVTDYKVKAANNSTYVGNGINPIEGNPLYSVYSYYWAGLDTLGNPQGILDGKISQNYSAIIGSTSFANLKYNGPVNPTYFGSLRNTISYDRFSLSFNITYKFGNYFRRQSMYYASFFSSQLSLGAFGSPDYAKRWQKPGDEKITSVPSMIYPANSSRDGFYAGSEILVDKGDLIRLQDLQLSYDLNQKWVSRLHISNIRIYAYANNLGLIWKANKDGIDPDYVPNTGYPVVYPNPRTIAAGVKIDF